MRLNLNTPGTPGELFKIMPEGNAFRINGEIYQIDDAFTANAIRRLGWCLGSVLSDGSTVEIMLYASTHTHSEFSILDGMSKIKDLAKTAVGAMALTDHGNMFGTFSFQKAMQAANKKPLIGCEVYMREDGFSGYYHLILIAKSDRGLHNLIKIVSEGYNRLYKGRAMVNKELLEKYHEGIICTSACVSGELPRAIASGDMGLAEKIVSYYKNLFKEDFYIEIQNHGFELESKVNPVLLQLANDFHVKVVAGFDSHYTLKEDKLSHDIVLAIHDGTKISEPHRSFDGQGYHIASQEEAYIAFQDIPEALTSTLEIVMKCNASYQTGVYHNPRFDFIPAPFKDDVEYFRYLVAEGYKERIVEKGLDGDEYSKRLKYETDIILNMGYASYFLIVREYIVWAKEHDILVGPGRGSAAGSLIAYCLKITELDPLRYGLLFERFLNPDRVSMPDIDVDFEDSKRYQVIDHIKELYGQDRVGNIVTFGTLAARSVVRDVAKAYELQWVGSQITKLIPQETGITIKKAIELNPELQNLIATNSDAKQIIEQALKLEGNSRNVSTHACGVVIAPKNISEFIPTCQVGNKKDGYSTSTQFTMTEVEELGLLKMDFLGLKTMSTIGDSVRVIRNSSSIHAKGIEDYLDIPLNDPYIYKEISKGQSYAVFQIESAGMRSFMRQLYQDIPRKIKNIEDKYECSGFGHAIMGRLEDREGYELEMSKLGDECFERMIAGVAMYRPGPMDYIPDYIEGMKNSSGIRYDTPELEPILEGTYGVIVYQEQVMQIVQKLAGFTMAQADVIRKAMGKKKEEILVEYREYFLYGSGDTIDKHSGKKMGIVGCIENGIAEDVAIKIWEKMKDFAKYAFNKSHAATYAVITVKCAWLKYYFPAIYMCASINTYILDSKMKEYIQVTKKMGIKILPPAINRSEELFSVVDETTIIFGFMGLKGVKNLCSDICKERSEHGPYTSEQDLAERILAKKNTLESLIYSGCFDEFPGTRRAKIAMIDNWLKAGKSRRADLATGQMSFFDMMEDFKESYSMKTPIMPEMDKETLLSMEKEYSGLFISEHPLDSYADVIEANKVQPIAFLCSEDEESGEKRFSKSRVRIAGIVVGLKTFYTKKDNRPMAVFTLEDQTSEVEVVVFPDDYMTYRSWLTENEKVCLEGHFDERDDEVQFLPETIVPLSKLRERQQNKCIYVGVTSKEEYLLLEEILRQHSGSTSCRFLFGGKLYKCKNLAAPSHDLFMELEGKFGRTRVQFR